jgi:hypothetical protein
MSLALEPHFANPQNRKRKYDPPSPALPLPSLIAPIAAQRPPAFRSPRCPFETRRQASIPALCPVLPSRRSPSKPNGFALRAAPITAGR